MARFKANEAENYGGQGGGGYFSLKDDGDVAQIRFCYNTIDDVEGYAIHEVDVEGKTKDVECLRAYNEPISKCPFCEARMPQRAKLLIPVYDIEEDKIKIWTRGKKFFAQLSSLCSRYTNSDTNLVNNVFEIERQGKAGSTSTTYGIYQISKDDTRLEDLPGYEDIEDFSNKLVLQKTADDMNYYLEAGEFPPEDEDDIHVRRRDEAPARRSSDRAERRTPANSRGRNNKF